MVKSKQRLTVCCLMLWCLIGTAMAQNDPQFVIKKDNHYLAHVNNALANVDAFDPATCLWFSGPNVKNNYYFMDGSNRRYLKAPLTQGGTLSLSSSNPGTVVLNTTSDDYYFYAWDHGVARGVQRPMDQCTGENPALPNGLNPYGNQCWEVVWVSYENNTWKMSTADSYSIVLSVAALYHTVTVTPHEEVITPVSGGITSISNDFSLDYTSPQHANQALNCVVSNYFYSITPAYTCYGFEAVHVNETNPNNSNSPIVINIPEEFHYFDANGNALSEEPTATLYNDKAETGREWTISGDGAAYLSFSDGESLLTSSSDSPTVYYRVQNTSNSHKQATITLVVTYEGGATQTRTVTVTAKTSCQNPAQASTPVVTFEGVTVSWLPTADSYTVSWKKTSESSWTSTTVGDVTSHIIRDLEGDTEYEYKVKADCSSEEPSSLATFTTKPQNAVILGSIFGGGRMADVMDTTVVIIVNCDSIGAVYGGNDIAGTVYGTVSGAGGSTIILGVNSGDTYASTYGTTDANIGVRIGDVYGGGNGYYAYNGTTIEQASYNTTYDVANGASIVAFTPAHPEGVAAWTNNTGSSQHWVCPTIPKANITVAANDHIKIDSLFGGAKNAILNNTTNDVNITINGGTIFTVFGGNNFGGSLGNQSHENITVNNTTVKTTVSDYQANQLGRDFGIGYLFGGGNKVQGQNVAITINGGQTDTIFGGGNSADVRSTQVTVNCALNKTYFQGLSSYSGNTITSIDAAYKWEGKGYYNIRTLFGGNNRANMEGVPTLNLTSGGIGTVYGGGNAGDMTADATDNGNGGTLTINDNNVKYGTHVKTDSPNILIDYLYGGCQMSNVYYSTWVEIKNGHVGTVYGGCNISGDVGSTRVDRDQEPFVNGDPNPLYQKVYGAPYVVASGGTVYNNVFAGSNGLYHCKDAQGIHYIAGINYDPFGHSYVGMTVPTHNETYVIIKDNVLVKGNVYAGGNLACVGFQEAYEAFPELVGLSSVRMSGGTVDGNVFGGGNMASIYGSNEIQVSGGSIGVRLGGALYGGNDRLGKAGIISNRVMPSSYNTASDGYTSLNPGGELNKVKTYLGVTGSPTIHTVYGGGNGAYDDYNSGNYCDPSNLPIQTNIFVDIAIDGGNNGGHIQNVFGGGNGVYADGFIKVFLNVQNCTGDTRDHVDTIYGGNNMGDMSVVPDIIMLHGNVHTVYGGCNSGAMAATGDKTKTFTVGGTTYDNVGSYVRLLSTYPGSPVTNNQPTYFTPTAKVTGAVYGGCRMNGVTNNSLVLVEGGNHSGANFFGGSDISGDVSGISYVVVNGSYANNVYNGVIGDAYGGGNGNYQYGAGQAYEGHTPPYCKDARVIMLNGQAANLYAGGYAGDCGITSLQLNDGLVSNKIFGGGNMAGTTTSHNLTTTTVNNGVSTVSHNTITTAGTSTVTMNGGTVNTGVYGGSNAQGIIASDVVVNVNGGTVGAMGTGTRADVYGGGYGHETHTAGDVTVNIASSGALTGPTINGEVYGGSALGQVSASDKTTTVNFYKGTINGDVYGGGLGNGTYAAEVSGDVEVNILGGVFNSATGTAGGGAIYGCNNANGTPKGDVNVNIYATDHVTANSYPTTPSGGWNVTTLANNASTQAYAINAVFGGGNLASYKPAAVGEGDPHSTTVHVYNCDNTIRNVFGGGNAADVGIGTSTTTGSSITQRNDTYIFIEGGRIHRLIGGGNGEDPDKPAANIFGTANTTVYAGLIDEVYGGANVKGDVDAINLTISNPSNSTVTNTCGQQVYGKVFGCANAADYNRSVTTNILCGVGEIGELYGGSNLADIGRSGSNTAHVTLNVYGGIHAQVFAGSKGDLASLTTPGTHTDKASNIYGDVTLNLFGGKITDAYGGSNYNGDIKGTITVNVLDKEDSSCAAAEALDLTNVYGASNLAAYTPSGGSTTVSPVVNVIHIAKASGISGNVYGGGNQAQVTSSPQVNIGYDAATMASILTACSYTQPTGFPSAYVTGNVFGGGNEADVNGTPTVNLRHSNSQVSNIFGGGNNAGASATVVNVYEGQVVNGVYGGCNTQGTVTGDINVNIYGSLGTSGTPLPDGIFGGGKGGYESPTNQGTKTDGNITVTIDKPSGEGAVAPTVYSEIYGGSAFGEVGASGKIAKVVVKDGTIHGNIFGGGKGDGTHQATVTGNSGVDVEGGLVLDSIFGGCNVNGIVLSNALVNITGGTLGAAATGTQGQSGYVPEVRSNVYGGGLGTNTKVKGDVAVTVNGSGPVVYGDMYGGSAKGTVNTENGTSQSGSSKTEVTLTSGTVHGRVYGGGHGIDDANANVYGPVTVLVNGAGITVDGSVFGGNNLHGTPQGDITVNMSNGTVTNLVGGGNQADYAGTPSVLISGGTVLNRVIGGANAANVGGTSVSISGGTHFPTGNLEGRGVYGGCNASGNVSTNVQMDITGGTFGSQTIITQDAANETVTVNIHGGGYGESTTVTGNVTVNYGANSSTYSPYPKLYGDLYGGSALGSVNTLNNNTTTTVNVRNGSFGYGIKQISVLVGGEPEVVDIQYGGNVYGGGLGQKAVAAGTDPITGNPTPAIPGIEATVNGKVYVNVGAVDATSATGYSGLTNLEHCNVYGCNNLNGSPQSDVYVKVYQTYHTANNVVSAAGFAIGSIYGGGNEADYRPAGTTTAPTVNENHTIIEPGTGPRTHIYVYSCENTVNYIYGGGNAAFAVGTVVIVEGGHFGDIFGGGNGLLVAANIGSGGVGMNILAGTINYQYEGSNLNGGNLSGINYIADASDFNACPGGLQVETYFFGANEAVTHGTLKNIIECSDAGDFNYTNVFAGSRYATIYGDLRLTVRGGTITNLYGGSQGYPTKPAHVRRFPTQDEITNGNYIHGTVSQAMLDHLEAHPEDYGTGGNVILTIEGGTITNVFGGNQVKGNIDGSIIIIVDSTQLECPLSVGTIYAASDRADYQPFEVTDATGTHEPQTPFVYVKNGTVTGNIYGGCKGEINSETGAVIGHTYSNPVTVIGNIASGTNNKSKVGGNVFAGGYIGNVSGDTRVVLQGNATVNQNVYGGGYLGDVDGETNVILTPTTHTLTVTPPTNGTIKVNSENTSSMLVGENSSIHVEAIPDDGYVFSGWTVSGTGAWINSTSWAVTVFNMGTTNATISASFTPVSTSKGNKK